MHFGFGLNVSQKILLKEVLSKCCLRHGLIEVVFLKNWYVKFLNNKINLIPFKWYGREPSYWVIIVGEGGVFLFGFFPLDLR